MLTTEQLDKIQKQMYETLPVYQETDSYNFKYSKFAEDTDMQIENNRWTWQEINLEKDKHDFLQRMTEKEKYATIFALKLFLKYEVMVGGDYWSGRFRKMFKRPEFKRKASFYAHQEENVHAPFYNEFNKVMGLTTDEFYESYKQSPILVERIKFISSMLKNNFDLYSLGAFTFIEGAVLYNNFAWFKHFQVGGKNLIANAVAGTDQSVLDEDNHAHYSAECFRILINEGSEYGIITDDIKKEIYQNIQEIGRKVEEHEYEIIKAMFPYGECEEYTIEQAIGFTRRRINECLMRMDIDPIFKIENDTVFQWFKSTTSLYSANDNFHKKSREYKSPGNNLKIYSVDVSQDILR